MDVTVYSAPWCPWCQKVKKFLKEKNIEFVEKTVEDEKNAHESMEVSGQTGIPVTVVDGKFVLGFDVPKLKTLLKLD